MRHCSFFGPLLLVTIGGLILWHNIHPEFQVFDWFSQYWPFLLIGWGLLPRRRSWSLIARETAGPMRSPSQPVLGTCGEVQNWVQKGRFRNEQRFLGGAGGLP